MTTTKIANATPVLHHITPIKNKAGQIVSYRVRIAKADAVNGQRVDTTLRVAEHSHQPAALLAAIRTRDAHLAQ